MLIDQRVTAHAQCVGGERETDRNGGAWRLNVYMCLSSCQEYECVASLLAVVRSPPGNPDTLRALANLDPRSTLASRRTDGVR